MFCGDNDIRRAAPTAHLGEFHAGQASTAAENGTTMLGYRYPAALRHDRRQVTSTHRHLAMVMPRRSSLPAQMRCSAGTGVDVSHATQGKLTQPDRQRKQGNQIIVELMHRRQRQLWRESVPPVLNHGSLPTIVNLGDKFGEVFRHHHGNQ